MARIMSEPSAEDCQSSEIRPMMGHLSDNRRMSHPRDSVGRANVPPRWEPVSPVLAIFPGGLLLFAGLWMLFDGGPVALASASVAVGLALLLLGVVAKAVAWGLELHKREAP